MRNNNGDGRTTQGSFAMGDHRSKEDEVMKLSSSIFVTNFLDKFTAKELCTVCNQYGNVVDAFIPNRRSKSGKRFGFVHFIKIFDIDRLVNNICTIWVGRFKLHGNIARFQRSTLTKNNSQISYNKGDKNISKEFKEREENGYSKSYVHAVKIGPHSINKKEDLPVIVLDETCFNQTVYFTALMGKVKDFTSLTNLKVALANEGFENIKLKYMGGFWVMIEFNTEAAKERVTWVDIEGIPLKGWSKNTFSRITSKRGELLYFDEQEEGYLHSKRAKEVSGWNLDFEEEDDVDVDDDDDDDDDSKSDDEMSKDGIIDENRGMHKFPNVEGESDLEEVAETIFEKEQSSANVKEDCIGVQKDTRSEDLFNIYELLNKKKDNNNGDLNSDDNLKYPPGFTPNSSFNSLKNDTDRSLCSGHFKKCEIPSSVGPSMFRKINSTISDYFVMIQGEWVPNGKNIIISIYAPQELCEKKMWDYLILVLNNWNGEVVIMGDFNEVRFDNFMEQTWNDAQVTDTNALSKLTKKLKYLKENIHRWIKDNKDSSKNYKQGLKDDLVKINLLLDNGEANSDILIKHMDVLKSLQDLVKLDSMETTQKTKIKWMIEGDENLKYYHVVLNKKRNQLAIRGILAEGRWIESPVLVKGDMVNDVQSAFVANRQLLGGPFILNDLFQWLQRVVDAGMFIGIKLGPSLQVSHLFYADDAAFMGHWSDSIIDTILRVLDCFYHASGFHINMTKSKLMGFLVSIDKMDQAAMKIGCAVLKVPFSYLGTKVGCLMSLTLSWNEIVNNFLARLSKWKMKTLSIGGRLALLKSLLGSLPIYHMSLFKVPSKVIKGIHGVDCKLGKNVQNNHPSVWLDIVREDDAWRDGNNFKSLYPIMYALETQKNVIVASKMSHVDMSSSFRRAPKGGSEESQFTQLLSNMEGFSLVDMKDRWIWSLEGCGEFFIAYVRKVLDDRSLLVVLVQNMLQVDEMDLDNYWAWPIGRFCTKSSKKRIPAQSEVNQNHPLWGVRVPLFIVDFHCVTGASSGSLPSVLLLPDHRQLVWAYFPYVVPCNCFIGLGPIHERAVGVIRLMFRYPLYPCVLRDLHDTPLPLLGEMWVTWPFRSFFWVDDFACPARFPWHTTKNVTTDPAPVAADFNVQEYATLVAHPSLFGKFPEEFLCLVGLSRHYTLDEKTYPLFLDKDREVVPDRGGSELDASVDKLFDEGGSGAQSGQGDSASVGGEQGMNIQPVTETTDVVVEDVILLQPRRLKKRKTIVSDVGGPSHPPKELREDHGTPSGVFVGGKSRPSVPVITAATTITSTADHVVVVKEKIVERSLFAAESASTGGTDPAMVGLTDLTGSDFLAGGIRTVINPDSDLQKTYEEEEVVEEKDQLLKARDEEIDNIMAQLLLKEAKVTEAIRLRTESSKLETAEKSLRDEINSLNERNTIFEKERNALDVKVTDL
nr:nucleotide-binding alpha-beta plait domain-containing protein [Tanacetum cinerariifolium]